LRRPVNLRLRSLLPTGSQAKAVTLDEHLSDHGEVLLHLLIADLRRLLLTAFERGDDDLLRRSPALVDQALQTGDEKLRTAVAVSFVGGTRRERQEKRLR
jgi:hypothetical protein